MATEIEKPAVPVPPAPTDGEQPLSKSSEESIAEVNSENNPPEKNYEEMLRMMQRINDPAYLHIVSMNELYDIVGQMKKLADRHGICLLLVHHTRKQPAGDKFEMISGTTGLLGCADGAFLLQKENRTDLSATLDIVGRDQPDQRLYLQRDKERLIWTLDHAEMELRKEPPDPIVNSLSRLVTVEKPEWYGSPTELVAALGLDIKPNVLTLRLNVNAGRLMQEHGIHYESRRTHSGRFIRLMFIPPEVCRS